MSDIGQIREDELLQTLKLMQERGLKQLRDFRHPSLKERTKRTVKAVLGRAGAGASDPLFWPAGFLMLGIMYVAKVQRDAGGWEPVWGYLQDWLHRDGKVRFADDAVAGCAALLLRQVSEELPSKLTVGGQATGVTTAKRVWEFLKNAPRDPAGSIIYHPSQKNRCIYADGVGMTAMFLSEYAEFQKRDKKMTADAQETLDTARLQLVNYMKYGMDAGTGLPYHGYFLNEDASCEKQGLVGWGRATGFLAMGFSSYLKHSDDEEMREFFFSMMRAVKKTQRQDGLFSWLLTAPEGHVDTSASAMLGWALCNAGGLAACSRRSEEVFQAQDMTERLAEGLKERVISGWLKDSLAECVDFAEHPQRYGTYPWGQGAVMMFFSELVTHDEV